MKINRQEMMKSLRKNQIVDKYLKYNLINELSIEDNQGVDINGIINYFGKIYQTNIHDLGNDEYEVKCSCNSNKICEHLLATYKMAISDEHCQLPYYYSNHIQEKIKESKKLAIERKENAHLEEMTSIGRSLINTNKKTHDSKIERVLQRKQYEIEATLVKEFQDYLISFKVGNEKKYVIQNITRFLEMIKNREFYRYGKQLEMQHDIESFDEHAKKQIQFMEYAQDEYTSNSHYYYDSLGKTIYLRNANLDEFYNTYANEGGSNFKCEDIDYKIHLKWREKEKYDILEINDDLSQFAGGKNHLYRINFDENNSIFQRVFLDENGKCRYLINCLLQSPIRILKKERNDFIQYVLKDLFDVLDIEGLVDLNIHSIQEILIFGDVNEDGNVTLKVEYIDENQHHLFAFNDEELLNEKQEIVEKYIQKYAYEIENGIALLDGNIDSTYEFIEEGLSFLQEYATIYVSDNLKNLNVKKSYNLSIGVKFKSDLLALDIQSLDIPKDEISTILSQYRKKKKFYRLKNGEMINLNSSTLEELNDFVDQYHIDIKDLSKDEVLLSPYRMFSIEEDANEANEIIFNREDSFNQALDNFSEKKMQDIQLPKQYSSILRDYQKDGVKWMKLLQHYQFNGILADDMGLGKTLQVIALIEDGKKDMSSLVVAPSSLVYNWKDEVEKFSKVLDCKCVVGSKDNRRKILEEKADLFITSYDYMRRDVDLYINRDFDYVVLDEAQYIKNQKTQNAISVKKLHAHHKLALTGTPIENSLAELWSIFDFLMPGYLFNYHYFLQHYETNIVKYDDDEAKERLKKLVTPFILRRNKKDVLKELPDKVEKVQYIEFDDEENKLYLAYLAQVNKELNQLMGNERMDKMAILAMMTRLRQICCEPRLLFDNIYHSSSKMKACMELITNLQANHQKVLVFSAFTSVLSLLEQELQLQNITYYKLTGETSKEERRELVNKFQQDDTEVFLISLKAGGTGLNLTAAQAVIHYDPWWNVSAQNQATDRTHRIGQEKNVQVFKLVMKNSIEEKILKLQEKKKDLADTFIEGNEGSIAKMSKEDIMELFKE
ncbi:MAG: DEAD/DEAH box helicase [Traorella sp.]